MPEYYDTNISLKYERIVIWCLEQLQLIYQCDNRSGSVASNLYPVIPEAST